MPRSPRETVPMPRLSREPLPMPGGAEGAGPVAAPAAAEPALRNRRTPVFLCGERARGDDAVAYAVAEALPAEARRRLTLVEAGALDVDHLLALGEGGTCVVVDAVAGPPPGTVIEVPLADLAARRLPAGARFEAATSTHALPIPAVLELAAVLRGAPVRGVFLGVGIADCALGAPLSPAVARAVPVLAGALARVAC